MTEELEERLEQLEKLCREILQLRRKKRDRKKLSDMTKEERLIYDIRRRYYDD